MVGSECTSTQRTGRGGARKGSGRKRIHDRDGVCARCGRMFTSTRGGRNKFCSLPCRSGTATVECVQCRSPFTVPRRKWRTRCCSAACLAERRRTVSLGRRTVPARVCGHCGYQFRKSHAENYCSRKCGGAARTARSKERIRRERAARQQAMQVRRAEREALRIAEAERRREESIRPTPCAYCGTLFPRKRINQPARYCSLSCRRKDQPPDERRRRRKKEPGRKHTDRARRYGVPRLYSIKPRAVYDRDGWTCRLCHGPISRRLFGRNDDYAPAVDHIIPLSVAGSPGHVWENVQASHRLCNSRKGARPLGQPRLL